MLLKTERKKSDEKDYFAFMVLTMVLSLAACSTNRSPSESTPEESSSQTNESTPTPVTQTEKILWCTSRCPIMLMTAPLSSMVRCLEIPSIWRMSFRKPLALIFSASSLPRPYPTDHDTLVDQAAEEQEQNARPVIAGQVDNMADYDVI